MSRSKKCVTRLKAKIYQSHIVLELKCLKTNPFIPLCYSIIVSQPHFLLGARENCEYERIKIANEAKEMISAIERENIRKYFKCKLPTKISCDQDLHKYCFQN